MAATRILNGAYDNYQAMSLGVSDAANIIIIINKIKKEQDYYQNIIKNVNKFFMFIFKI